VPKVKIILEAKYPNGSIQNKQIGIFDGGCNTLEKADADSLATTTNFQCYYAGYGHQYKIVKGEKSYLVMRKEFEEGSEDYNPPIQKYEMVSEFPFTN
ncbi:hypothetical protein H7X65_02980, partial [Candidatus Parcubacteria bacterium]|nr:hypothetical protein [Candidatus Parcubacteria bacterium]